MHNRLQEDQMTTDLFNNFSEPVIWFKPVRIDGSNVVDFEIAYCNPSACNFFNAAKEAISGQHLLTGSLIRNEQKAALFKQCLQVWETGKPIEDSYPYGHPQPMVTILKSQVMGGVVSIIRDRTEYFVSEKNRQEEAAIFLHILDASADGVMLLEAIRNHEGEVADFRLTHCNKAAFAMARISPKSVGKTLLEILPHLRNSPQFRSHRKVIETGEPVRIETTFRNEKGEEYGWFIVSLMKLGDRVVSTFIDITEKKEHEEKIKEQSDLLTSIFEASINAIFACEAIRDPLRNIIDLRIVKINRPFTNLLGVGSQEAEETSYLGLFPQAKEFGFFGFYCQVIESGESNRKELYYDDGKVKGWYDVSAVKRGTNGIVITFTDITESKLNKEALEDAARYMQDIIDSSQTGIMLLAPVRNEQQEIVDFRFKTVNRTVTGYAGKEPAELRGKLHSETFYDGETGLIARYKTILEGEEPEQRFENYYAGKSKGVWLDVLAKKRNGDLLITFHDFSPLKILQLELTAAAEKLSTVVNSSQAGMFTLNPVYNSADEIDDFRFGIVNQAVANFLGASLDKLPGSTAGKHFPAYKNNGLFNIYRDTYLTNKQHLFDFHYEEGFDVYLNIHTVKAGDEVLVTFTDHTSLKRLQLQLQSSLDELKHTNANLEEFAYAASHDLQEPLRKIHYFSERLRRGIEHKLSTEEITMFGRIENASKRMSLLINDLLAYSQITVKTDAFKTVDLAEIIQQVISDLETSITEKKAVITTEEFPSIKGDAVQLGQLFQNLLSNSLKYSKNNEAPAIIITTRIVLKGTNSSTKPFHEIAIRDNGIGFDPEHSQRIFKIFHRLHGQNEFPGTGIGLAIAAKVVDNHNGFLRAESQPGLGSTFTILLPVTDGKTEAGRK